MTVEIVTSRLRLRPFAEDDLANLAELFADEAVQKYLAVGPLGPKGAQNFAAGFIQSSKDEGREGGTGAMAVTSAEKSLEGGLIGYCGLRYLPDRISAVELVYALQQSHWGQGLATEAARAVIQWGFANLNAREIIAFTRPEHGASRRVMEKSGMTVRGETDRYYGETLAVYGVDRPGPGHGSPSPH